MGRPSKPTAGRPSTLDDLRAHRITAALKAGHSFGAAARAGGVEEHTLHNWRRRGASGDERYSAFFQRIEEACAEAENRCVQVLRNALEGDDAKLATDTAWRWLARRRPHEWAEMKGEPRPEADVSAVQTADDITFLESVLAAARSSASR